MAPAGKLTVKLPGSGPVTCECRRHRDRCRFGHNHIWQKPYMANARFVRTADTYACGDCWSVCTGEELEELRGRLDIVEADGDLGICAALPGLAALVSQSQVVHAADVRLVAPGRIDPFLFTADRALCGAPSWGPYDQCRPGSRLEAVTCGNCQRTARWAAAAGRVAG